jgi:hypothetical protein
VSGGYAAACRLPRHGQQRRDVHSRVRSSSAASLAACQPAQSRTVRGRGLNLLFLCVFFAVTRSPTRPSLCSLSEWAGRRFAACLSLSRFVRRLLVRMDAGTFDECAVSLFELYRGLIQGYSALDVSPALSVTIIILVSGFVLLAADLLPC